MTKSIYLFYGFSGSPRKAPKFPDGVDHDKSFQLVAQTLGDSLKKSFPSYNIIIRQAWMKDVMIQELLNASDTISQVHVICHGDSTWLSLAFYYNKFKRLVERARKYNVMSGSEKDRGIKAMKEEDALVTGYFSEAIEKTTLDSIKSNHSNDAYWQIWGCYAGYDVVSFSGIGHSEIDPYLKRFNLGKANVPGIAIDIAKSLKVTCTAAIGKGLEFWHGDKKKKVVLNTEQTPAKKPFWLWNTKGSKWVSYDSNGALLPKPVIFQTPREQNELTTPKPPKWLTDLYWS